MKDHSNSERGFHHTGGAWYGKAALAGSKEIDRVQVGMYHREGGTTGEFHVEWISLSGKVTPKLVVFDDAWHALQQFNDVLAAMAERDGEDITPEQFCELLKGCGVIDMTARKG